VPAQTSFTRLLQPAMVVAPLLLLASSIAYAVGGGSGEDQTGGAIQVYAATAFVFVVIGLARATEGAFPRAATALTLVGVLGAVGGATFGITSIANALSGSRLQDVESAQIYVGLLLPGVIFPVALIGFGVALFRAGIGPRASGPLLVLGAILFPLARINAIELLAVAGDLVLVAALVPLGLATLPTPVRTAATVETSAGAR
jgi:hypothetical protein